MRAFTQVGFTALLIGVAIAGCSGDTRTGPTPAPPEPSIEAELAQIRQSVWDLKGAVEAAGRMTPALQARLDDIRVRVGRWQERSGRQDVSVSGGHRRTEDNATAVTTAQRGDPGGSCLPCPPVTVIGGRVCFLEYSSCTPGSFIGRWCQYVCVYL
jgi:hypothetical protein